MSMQTDIYNNFKNKDTDKYFSYMEIWTKNYQCHDMKILIDNLVIVGRATTSDPLCFGFNLYQEHEIR